MTPSLNIIQTAPFPSLPAMLQTAYAAHSLRLGRAARAARDGRASTAPVESVVIPGGRHSWLYEFPAYRSAVARFLATALGGPLDPEEAARIAATVPASRIPDGEGPITAIAAEPGGFRSLARIAMPGAASGGGLPDEAAPTTPDEPFNLLGPAGEPEPAS